MPAAADQTIAVVATCRAQRPLWPDGVLYAYMLHGSDQPTMPTAAAFSIMLF